MKERRFEFALEDSRRVGKRAAEVEKMLEEYCRSSVPPSR